MDNSSEEDGEMAEEGVRERRERAPVQSRLLRRDGEERGD